MKNANPVSLGAVALLAALLAGCGRVTREKSPSIPALTAGLAVGATPRFGYEIVRAWPHDRRAFTQGLVAHGGALLESTGLSGQSSLREVEIATGRLLKQVSVAAPYFAEGLAVIGGRAFQLTWQHQKGFIYDAGTFRLEGEFAFAGEGWGLATDGRSLILSDGTARIRFIDPATFRVTREIEVSKGGQPVMHLNELEWIRGEIFANVWRTDEVVRIDPATGRVTGVVDFSGLLSPAERGPDTDVLNGIAYDAGQDRLFVTGKNWPKLFEVRLRALP